MNYEVFVRDYSNQDELQKVLGLVTEAAEVADLYNKKRLYGTYPSDDDLISELSDTLFYVVSIAQFHGITLQEMMEYNMDKLEKRYEHSSYNL